MYEIPIDPAQYTWRDREDDFEVVLPVTRTYKLALTRRVRVGRHEVLRTVTVYATSPNPRIKGRSGTIITTNKENTSS